jgi:hypothetical protein
MLQTFCENYEPTRHRLRSSGSFFPFFLGFSKYVNWPPKINVIFYIVGHYVRCTWNIITWDVREFESYVRLRDVRSRMTEGSYSTKSRSHGYYAVRSFKKNSLFYNMIFVQGGRGYRREQRDWVRNMQAARFQRSHGNIDSKGREAGAEDPVGRGRALALPWLHRGSLPLSASCCSVAMAWFGSSNVWVSYERSRR